MSNYDELISRVKELSIIESIGGLLAWDQETFMPPKGAQLRSESLAYLSKTAHSALINPEMGSLLNSLVNNKSIIWKEEALGAEFEVKDISSDLQKKAEDYRKKLNKRKLLMKLQNL